MYKTFNVAEVHGFTYGTTNPVDVWGAYDHPTANGHYAFSAPNNGYTNLNHVFLYLDGNSFEWEIGPTNSDPNINTNWYYYLGSNVFPTNSYITWSDSGMASLFAVNVGTSVSTNFVTGFTYQGERVIDQGSTASTPIKSITDPNGNLFYTEYVEDTTPYYKNFFQKQMGFPLGSYTNLYDSGHNFAAGILFLRLNGGISTIAGDNRGGAIVGIVYGTNALSAGVADLTHIGDLGGSFEFPVKRAVGYSTPETASWSYTDPIKEFGDGSVWLGNNPQSEHTIWPFAAKTYSAGTVNLRGEAKRPTLLIYKSATYTGGVTNGGIYSDGSKIHVMQDGADGTVLSSTGGNAGSLTNLNGNTLTVSATNRLVFSSVTSLTNTIGREANAIITAGTSVILQDTNGNNIATLGTIATLDIVVPMHVNMRLSGTGVSATLY